jgi:hypothetical protein
MPDPTVKLKRRPWAVGIAVFAAAMMIMSGVSQALLGIAALVNDSFLARVDGYVYAFDQTVWGWIHLLIGAGFIVIGCLILAAKYWVNGVAIAVVVINGLLNFLWLPVYPIGAVLLIAINVAIVWALAVTSKS